MIPNWDTYYMNLCHAVAKRSKDESTQLGCVIVDAEGILSTGYNSFPRGINDNVEARQKRPEKYKWFAHAEANAIYNAARTGTALKDATIYCQWQPCPACAIAIIQTGIREIVTSDSVLPERWQEDMSISRQMLKEGGVLLRQVQ